VKNKVFAPLEYKFNRKSSIERIHIYKRAFESIGYGDNCYILRDELIDFLNQILKREEKLEIDMITRLDGFFMALYYHYTEYKPKGNFYNIYLENGQKYRTPFLLKKLYNSPMYYFDIGCANYKWFKNNISKKKDLFNKGIIQEFEDFNCFKKKRMNIPQTTLLIGYFAGILLIKKEIKLKNVFDLLNEEYKPIYKNFDTIKIKNKTEAEV